MGNLSRETSPAHATLREAYEQNHYEGIVAILGRLSAQASTNFRTEHPRSEAHIARQEEVIASLRDTLDLMEREI